MTADTSNKSLVVSCLKSCGVYPLVALYYQLSQYTLAQIIIFHNANLTIIACICRENTHSVAGRGATPNQSMCELSHWVWVGDSVKILKQFGAGRGLILNRDTIP